MQDVNFKEKGCATCRTEMRKEIIKEIHEDAGCLACKRLYKALHEKDHHQLVRREHGALKAPGRRKL